MSIPHHSPNASLLASLLREGVTGSEAALALGISPSAVTQLSQTPEVLEATADARKEQNERSSKLDAAYDGLESKLLAQLEKTVPLLLRPMEIAKVLQTINGAKRRGVAAVANEGPRTVLALNLPVAIQAKFVLNAANQVVEAGSQTLVTMPSNKIASLAEARYEPPAINAPAKTIEDELGFS